MRGNNNVQGSEFKVDAMLAQKLAVWYNNHVKYPDKVRSNYYYYRHYSFIKNIQMIFCTVLGKKMEDVGEVMIILWNREK